MRIQPFTAYTAKLLLLHQGGIETKQTSFNRLKRDHGLDMDTLFKLKDDGMISISGCTLSGEIVDCYKSIVKKYARLYGYESAPSETDHEEKPWHEAFYRDNWPFPKKYYDALEADSSLLRLNVELEDILTPEQVHIWLNWGDVRYPLFCLRFNLGVNENKLRSFFKEYTKAFINGSMEDQKEHLSYKIQKDALMNYLGAKVGAGVDHNGVWIVPSQDGYEAYKDMKFVWSGSDVALVRPIEAILSLEHEGFIKLLEIEDRSGGAPDHFWGMFLQYRVLVTERGLEYLGIRRGGVESEGRSLKNIDFDSNKGIISFTDDQDRADKIRFQTTSKGHKTKLLKLFGELWRQWEEGHDEVSLSTLETFTELTSPQAVKTYIGRLNNLFEEARIKVNIKLIGINRCRLEIERVSTKKNKS